MSRGLTIIEVLVAIAVVGVVFVALAALQIASLRVTRDAGVEDQLLAAAVTRFEEVRTEVLGEFSMLLQACGVQDNCARLINSESNYDDVVLERASVAVDDVRVELQGMLELQVTATNNSGRTLFFKQYISCVDADPVPTLSSPDICGVP
jgi:prepilin-type N-terminal cleavage/methylation domain-containing protein